MHLNEYIGSFLRDIAIVYEADILFFTEYELKFARITLNMI